jgi:hypothetical protein
MLPIVALGVCRSHRLVCSLLRSPLATVNERSIPRLVTSPPGAGATTVLLCAYLAAFLVAFVALVLLAAVALDCLVGPLGGPERVEGPHIPVASV